MCGIYIRIFNTAKCISRWKIYILQSTLQESHYEWVVKKMVSIPLSSVEYCCIATAWSVLLWWLFWPVEFLISGQPICEISKSGWLYEVSGWLYKVFKNLLGGFLNKRDVEKERPQPKQVKRRSPQKILKPMILWVWNNSQSAALTF